MPLNFIRDDITRLRVDAIVNAANSSLLGGGGVDGAIHEAAGPRLLAECRKLGGCATGQAKITKGYRLPAKYVIHTVGPIYQDGKHGEEELLRSCYRNSLRIARDRGLHSVAFPLISAGVYGYPADQAIAVAIDEIRRFLFEDDTDMQVTLVFFDKRVSLLSKKLLGELRERIDDSYAEAHYDRTSQNRREREMRSFLRRKESEGSIPNAGDEAEDSMSGIPYQAARPGAQAPQAEMPEVSTWTSKAPQAAMPEASALPSMAQKAAAPFSRHELSGLLTGRDEGFTGMLLRKIDERGMTDVECYKKANIDRKLFSKIRGNPAYQPKKTTVFAFSIALRLSLPETEALLRKAGYAFSESSKTDIIIRYYIEHGRYDIFDINEALYEFDQALLGA